MQVFVRWRRATAGALRFRLRRIKLPQDWWEQFEQDFAAYVDPGAVRARNRERS